jgi:hypothetical protein
MSKQVAASIDQQSYTRLFKMPATQKEEALARCRERTEAIYEGLDVSREIRAVDFQRPGDPIFVARWLQGACFRSLSCRSKTEAGSGTRYVNFAAARPGASAQKNFGVY